jgi:hypothetical protein
VSNGTVQGNETPPSKSSGTIVILVGIYLVLIGLGVWASYNFTVWGTNDSLKNFAGLATVCIAAVSALMGMVTGFITMYKNQQAAANLESFKSDLQVKVLNQKIWTDLRFEHEKSKTANEASAYGKLSASLGNAYLLLAKLETSSWKAEDKLLMDNALLEVYAQLVYARSPEHRILWEKVRQRCRSIAEAAVKIDVAQQPALWQKETAQLAELYRQFSDVATAEINRAPTRQEPAP